MAALTADRVTRRRDDGQMNHPVAHPVLAATKIYYGSICSLDANGFLIPAVGSANLNHCLVAVEHGDNTLGGNGDILVKAEFGHAYHFPVVGGGLDRGDVGTPVFAADSGNVTTVAGTNTPVGKIAYYEDADSAWIFFKGPIA